MRQPDFQKPFDELSGAPRRLRYELRHTSCFGHDLLYLSSLIHDSRLRPSGVSRRGKRLNLAIDRDCWELGFHSGKEGSELHVAQSQLLVSPVLSVEWRVERMREANEEEPLWVYGLYLAEDYWNFEQDQATLVVKGFDWQLRVTSDRNLRVVLQDKTMPVLDSTYYAKGGRSAG